MKKVRLRKRDISYIRFSNLLFQLEIGLSDSTEYIIRYKDINKGLIEYSKIYEWLFNHKPINNTSIRVEYKYKKSRGYSLKIDESTSLKIKSPNNVL